MLNINNIVDLNHTISRELFEDSLNIWEVIPKIKEGIVKIGNNLDKDKYKKIASDIWISKSAVVSDSALIEGPCIIDDDSVIRHCAYIRGGVIVGKGCVIGNSCEIKNTIIFDNSQIPHFNYVGDSIIGYHAHLGAGVILSNLKSDGKNVVVKLLDQKIETNLRKFGAIVGNFVEVGCNSVLCPGTIVGPNSLIYPLTRVRGVIDEGVIVKDSLNIVKKEIDNE